MLARSVSFWLLFFLSAGSFAQTSGSALGAPTQRTADDIMARVAVNQDRAEAARSQFVYVQHARLQSRKGETVMCEEITDSRVVPSSKGQTQTLLALSGHVRDGKRMIHYTAMPVAGSAEHGGGSKKQDDGGDKDGITVGDKETILDSDAGNTPVAVSDTDIDLVENMRGHFTSDKNSKDGVRAGLFPLTTAQQKDMVFDWKGREMKNGRDTYHVVFRPKDKADYGWKGDAWIDATAFEPVVVRTALSRSLPLGVRALLGTNVPGLGFTAVYAPQAGDVWFPASFGTEFKIKLLFLFHRQVVVSVENRSFERTHVNATVHTEEARPVTAPSEQTSPQR